MRGNAHRRRSWQTNFAPLSFVRSTMRAQEQYDIRKELHIPEGRPVALLLPSWIPDTDMHVFRPLLEKFAVVMKNHAGTEAARENIGGSVIYPPTDFWERVGWLTVARQADVLVVDADSSVAVTAIFADKPMVVFPFLGCEQRLRELYPGVILDQTMAEMFAYKGAHAELTDAVASAMREAPAKRRARRQYFHHVVGCVDGYEDYRVAFQVLRLVGVSEEALAPLYAHYLALPVSGARWGVTFAGLCDPADPRAEKFAGE